MTDVEEILNLLSRYCRALDDRDFDQLTEILAEDVRFEMGEDVTESRQALFDFMAENLWPPGRHLCVNPIISVDGDDGRALSEWLWLDADNVVGHSGRYSDEFRRDDGRWVFSVRRI